MGKIVNIVINLCKFSLMLAMLQGCGDGYDTKSSLYELSPNDELEFEASASAKSSAIRNLDDLLGGARKYYIKSWRAGSIAYYVYNNGHYCIYPRSTKLSGHRLTESELDLFARVPRSYINGICGKSGWFTGGQQAPLRGYRDRRY